MAIRFTYILVLAVLLQPSETKAGISVVSFDSQNLSASVLTNIFTVSVQAGDVAVLTVAGNKRASVAPIAFASTAGSMTAVDTSATDPYPTSWSAYLAITNGGAYDFTVVSGGPITAKSGIHILRATSGAIQFLDAAEFVSQDGNDLSDQTLVYDWGGAAHTGVVVEVLSSRTAVAAPLDVTVDVSGSDLRLICSGAFTGTAFSSTYTFSGGTADAITQTGVGLAFAEGEGEPPPPAPTNRVSPYAGTNILFIAIDDMKPLTGAYGDPHAITPNMDALSSLGTTFYNAQCQWAVCGPSRASLTTGLMPEETGVLGFKTIRGDAEDPAYANTVVRPNVVTLPQHFRHHGFRTAAVGKIHDPRTVGSFDTNTLKVADNGRTVDDPPSWGDPVDPLDLPADFFTASAYISTASGFDPPGKPTSYATNLPDSAFEDGIICDSGIGLLQSLATNDTQFFLGVGFKKPHLPFVAPQAYWDLYERTNFAIHPFQDHPLHEVAYTWNYANELATYDDIADPTNVPPAKQLEMIHGYYACVSFIDALVGRLMDELETLGLASNTIVVLWGDHGFHLGDHAEWAKHTNLEQASRVPMIMYNPFGGVSNQVSTTPVTFTDIFPTLCELAGIPIPEQPLNENEAPTAPASGRSLKGHSLAGIVNGEGGPVRTGALTLFRRGGAMGYAYRTDRYRYIEWISGGAVVARELYDYVDDPMETINLAGEPDYDPLMYQYSLTMREEMDAFALSGSDTACPNLQNSPALNTMTNVPALPIAALENQALHWPDAAGRTYRLVATTNLLSGAWTPVLTGLTNSPARLPISGAHPVEAIRVELETP